MIKFIAILWLTGAAMALVEVDELPNELRELIPEKLKDIYQKLSKDEKEAYHRVHEKLMWPDNVLEEMKTTDEMLYEKMKKFRSFFKDDIDQLTQRGRDFFEKVPRD
ncbi:SEC-2 protein [Aphelenchoides avenae]|nr:SEC-2 protein [Aphelenchus avenae]